MSLQEAIKTALDNSEVLRVLSSDAKAISIEQFVPGDVPRDVPP